MRTEKQIKKQIKCLQKMLDKIEHIDDDDAEYYDANSGWIEALEWVLEGKKSKKKT